MGELVQFTTANPGIALIFLGICLSVGGSQGLNLLRIPGAVYPKQLINAGVLLIVIGAGWLGIEQTWEYIRKPEKHNDSALLQLAEVPARKYVLSQYLRNYIPDREQVSIPQSFAIQTGEVTVSQFREYVDSLNLSPQDRQARFGSAWEKDTYGQFYPEHCPVDHVSYQAAADYAAWLSNTTGQRVRLPRYNEWIAASVHYAQEETPVLFTGQDYRKECALRSQVDHLIGNVLEWVADDCQTSKGAGHRLVGENYRTDPLLTGQQHCGEKALQWAGVGFRVVHAD